jgi:hypothetical protein
LPNRKVMDDRAKSLARIPKEEEIREVDDWEMGRAPSPALRAINQARHCSCRGFGIAEKILRVNRLALHRAEGIEHAL